MLCREYLFDPTVAKRACKHKLTYADVGHEPQSRER